MLGFTVVFSVLGLFAGTIGAFLREYKIVVNIIGGTLIVVFGLSFWSLLSFRSSRECRADELLIPQCRRFCSVLFIL